MEEVVAVVDKRKRLEDVVGEIDGDHMMNNKGGGSNIKLEDDDDDQKKEEVVVHDQDQDQEGNYNYEDDEAADQEGEEVEEFFEILKKIRVAVKYFEKGTHDVDGRRRETTTTTAERLWKPSFEREDFEFEGFKVKENVENTVLDLNARPL